MAKIVSEHCANGCNYSVAHLCTSINRCFSFITKHSKLIFLEFWTEQPTWNYTRFREQS